MQNPLLPLNIPRISGVPGTNVVLVGEAKTGEAGREGFEEIAVAVFGFALGLEQYYMAI